MLLKHILCIYCVYVVYMLCICHVIFEFNFKRDFDLFRFLFILYRDSIFDSCLEIFDFYRIVILIYTRVHHE